MAKKRKGRPVDGILLLNKPLGITSNAALQKVKYLFIAAKAGHTGSLDPLATGVLPICLGEATKFTQYLLDADKRYNATIRFGMTTDSGDADGEITAELGSEGLTAGQVEQALAGFRGAIEQVPSMFSALKSAGKPLYKLAREGKEVPREARPVTVYAFDLLGFRPGPLAEADVAIHCSKGTYVRTLAQDLGDVLGCGAYISCLHRTAAGPFGDADAIDLETLEARRSEGRAEDLDSLLLPVDAAVQGLEKVELPEAAAWYLRRGQPVILPQVYRQTQEGAIVRIFQEGGAFLGVGEISDDGMVAPRRLVV